MDLPGVLGTVPQWGTFGCLVAILAAVLRYLPERMRAIGERRKAEAEANATAAATWRDIEQRVSAELEECRQGRERDGALLKRVDDENFRMRIVLSMTLDEIEHLDPDSQMVLKAKAIMAVPQAPSASPDLERERLAELLAHIDRPERHHRAG